MHAYDSPVLPGYSLSLVLFNLSADNLDKVTEPPFRFADNTTPEIVLRKMFVSGVLCLFMLMYLMILTL